MKKCNKCLSEKPLNMFHKNSNEKDGYKYTCKECMLGHPPREKNPEVKECKICLNVKPSSEFRFTSKLKGYISSYCKTCSNAKRDVKRSKDANYKLNNKVKWLKRKYSITVEQYDDLYKKQLGLCKICDKKAGVLCVDHCHESMDVRGLLCHQCNVVLGMAKDSVNILKKAILYLEDSGTCK